MAFEIKLSNGERINAAVFDRINRVEDSKLPNNRKSAASLAAYRKHFKAEFGTINVPTAEYCEINVNETLIPRKCPQDYIVFEQKQNEDYENVVEYDYDDEDNNWLQILNDERKKNKEKEIDYETFEMVMDRLEKESIFELKPSASFVPGSSGESDDVCCVCCDGETSNVNQIIYCDMCNIAVHQDCYGVPYIPAGQWLCRKCKVSPSSPVECCLCPNTGGALKQTADGRWAHVVCAIWLNEVHFGNAVFLEPIEGVDNSLRRRSKLKCLVCRQKMGACLQCSTRSCLKAFHVTCAQNSGMSMRVCAKEDKNQDDGMDVQRYVYCHLHSDDDDSTADINVRKKRMENAIRNARRSMANLSEQSVTITMPSVSQSVVENIRRRVNVQIDDIVEYWYLKRKSRCGAPLIRRLQLSTKRSSGFHIEMNDEDKEIFSNVNKVRIVWESTRLLCELVKKREAVKLKHVDICQDIFNLVVKPLQLALEQTLDVLEKRDKNQVFTNPVVVEGYRTVIKNPMDLSTMKKRVKDGKSASFTDLRNDFFLMMDNCAKFNATNEWYLNYGKRFKKAGLNVIDEAEKVHLDRDKVITEPELWKELTAVKFYESLRLGESEGREKKKEDRQIEEMIRGKDKRARVLPSLTESTEKNSLSPKHKFPFGTTSSAKRKASENGIISNTRVKKARKDDTSTPRITRFFSKAAEAVVPAPLMAYRDNTAVKRSALSNKNNPLPVEAVSSESSAEEEDRVIRRSNRLLESSKSNEVNSDEEVYRHNDLVNVEGIAGRIIDPRAALVDDALPKELVAECKARRREPRVCVMLFGTENNWGWYLPSEIKHLEMGDNKGVAAVNIAKNWYNRAIEFITGR